MREELNSSLGVYSPTFFKMYVDTSADLKDISNLSDNDSAAYLHEYIHFLQDISTSFGFMNIASVVDYIRYVNDTVINNGTRQFKVPIIPTPNNSDNVFYNLELRKIYLGSSFHVNNIISINSVNKIFANVPFSNNNSKSVPKIIINYTKDNKLTNYEFGSQCISESMAIGIEQEIYPNILPLAPQLPYNSAQIISDYIYPIFSNNKLNIIALCDASLLSFHPGVLFYDTLCEMKKQSYYPQQPEDIYEFVKQIKFNYQNYITHQQLLIGMGIQASQQLSGYFTTHIFGQNTNWINNLISRAIDLRIQIPHFMLDIARMGKIQNNLCFSTVFTILGTPMVVNNNVDACFYSPLNQNGFAVHPEYLWAINQIYKTYLNPLKDRIKHCELELWCQQSCSEQGVKDYTDDRCWDKPWKRALDTNLCVYAQIWKTWGLQNEEPI